jgi:hypothetical protein
LLQHFRAHERQINGAANEIDQLVRFIAVPCTRFDSLSQSSFSLLFSHLYFWRGGIQCPELADMIFPGSRVFSYFSSSDR